MDNYFIGIMSGTSLDAVDAVLVDFNKKIELISEYSTPINFTLRQSILDLCHPGKNEIERLGTLDVELGEIFAKTCLELLKKSGISAGKICAIGSHGQTVRHRPNEQTPFTLQIGDPNIIAARTGITVVADFRRRDMALGGQGAPLVPAFHRYLLQNPQYDSCALNIGGMSNITWLPANASQSIIGFDSGPGNTLIDAWCLKHIGKPFDENGGWSAEGKANSILLDLMLEDSYFKKPPPKSTGREYFNLEWLQTYLNRLPKKIDAVDVQATLTELTAKSIAEAIQHYAKTAKKLWVCGGGIKNQLLMQRLAFLLPEMEICSTSDAGIDPQCIEAAAFAWLAQQTLSNQPGNLPSVTGASHLTILGAIYPKNPHSLS